MMKLGKLSRIAGMALCLIAATIGFSSCEEDTCINLPCVNGGACVDGFCKCPIGYEGTICDKKVVTRFLGTYGGLRRCDDYPDLLDSVVIFLKRAPDTVGIYLRSDPEDTIVGKAIGNSIEIGPVEDADRKRYFTARVLNDQLTYFVETTNKNPKSKFTCNFVSSYRRKP